MQSQLAKVRGDMCLVVDEAHNFGATKQREFMSNMFNQRWNKQKLRYASNSYYSHPQFFILHYH